MSIKRGELGARLVKEVCEQGINDVILFFNTPRGNLLPSSLLHAFFLQIPLAPRLLFRLSPLTESLEQAVFDTDCLPPLGQKHTQL